MGKASVSNISVSPCPPVIRKALDMACLLAVASGFVILPPSSSCGILWHRYSHPTILGWHPLCPVAPLAHLPPLTPRGLLYGCNPLRLGSLWYCSTSLGSCLPTARPLSAGHYVVGMSHLTRLVHGPGVTVVYSFISLRACRLSFVLGGLGRVLRMLSCRAFVLKFLSYLSEGARGCG